MRTRALLSAGLLLLMASTGVAAGDGHEAPPLEGVFIWSAMIYSIIAAIAVVVIGLKNAKRTHQK